MDVLSPSARQYTATGLKPETVYVFRLTAQTRKGWGEAAEALVVTTEKRGEGRNAQTPHLKSSPLNIKLEVSACAFFSSPSAHQPSHGASRRSPGSQSAFVMGTRQRWPVACSLLHSPVQGAARQQLDCPLCIGQPWDELLHRGQVVLKVRSLDVTFLLLMWRTHAGTLFYSKVKAVHLLPVPC